MHSWPSVRRSSPVANRTGGVTRIDGLAIGVMALLCTIWAVQQVASKVALTEGMPPFFQALARGTVAAALLLGWVGLRQGRAGLRRVVTPDRSWWPGLLLALLFAGEFLLLFPGVQRTTASRAVVLLFTGPFFTAIGAHLFVPAERLRPVHAAGLVLAFLGVTATLADADPGGSLLGDTLVLGAAVLWGFTTVVVKASPSLARLDAPRLLIYQTVGALPFMLVATIASQEFAWPHATGRAWAALGYQCVVVAFASYLTWYWLVTKYPVGKLSAFTLLTPLIGVVAGWALLGDSLGWPIAAGLCCVVVGLWIVNRR